MDEQQTCGRGLAEYSALPAQLTAPASGLFLERVFYDDPPGNWPLEPAIGCPDVDGDGHQRAQTVSLR